MSNNQSLILQSLMSLGLEEDNAIKVMEEIPSHSNVMAKALQKISTACILQWADNHEDFEDDTSNVGLNLELLDDREALSPEEILELAEDADVLEEGLEMMEEEIDGDI